MEPVRLSKSLAAELVRRLGEHISCTISILDRDGVIIASSDPNRIGTYNDSAYHLVLRGSASGFIPPNQEVAAAANPGAYTPIVHRGETIGVVGVDGDPQAVEPVAYAVRNSVEAAVEHELFKEQTIRHLGTENLFLNYLLYEEETSPAVVEGLAAKLGYEPGLHRAAILMRLPEGADANGILAEMKRNRLHTPQDILQVTLDGALLVFKPIRFSGPGIVSEYEKQTTEYVASVSSILGSRGGLNLARACVGSYQKDFRYYCAAYRQVLWLAGYLADQPPDPTPVSFYNYVLEYLISRVPRSELCQIFGATAQLLPADFVRIMRDSVEAMLESTFNTKEAASRLSIHRNTLTARLDKMKELLGVDLRWNSRTREFLTMLVRYLHLPGASANSK